MGDKELWDAFDKAMNIGKNIVNTYKETAPPTKESEKKPKKEQKNKVDCHELLKELERKPKDPLIEVNITRSGTFINNTKDLQMSLIRKIQNYYTLHDKTIMGYFVHTPLWSYKNKKLYIPRFGSFLLKNKFDNMQYINTITKRNPLPNLHYKGTFKGNQELVFKEIMTNWFNDENVNNGKAGLTLNLQAGHGKSFIGMALMGHLKCRTLIVAHNTTKLNEWVEILGQYLEGVTIGEYYGKKKIYGDIMVGIIHSLAMDEIKMNKYNSMREFYDSFDFIIFDECHEYVSQSRRKIYDICQTPYMLGLSATPDERSTDSLDKVTRLNCGSILVAENLSGYTLDDIPFKGEVTCVRYAAPPEFSIQYVNEKLDINSVPLLIAQICSDPYRLELVTELVLEQYNKKLNILVFADRRSYLEEIRQKLGSTESYILDDLGDDAFTAVKKLENIMDKTIRLVGGSSAKDMQLAISSKTIIFTTYQFMGTGVSIPALNSVILATPRKSKSKQYINRIFRLGSDYSITREIIDIVDTKVSLNSQWSDRKKYYDSQSYEIKTRKVSYKNYTKST
jgi:superfamily II DNA or RNA helicase